MKFDALFRNVNVPVIICQDDKYLTVVYENKSAVRLFNPMEQTEDAAAENHIALTDLFTMEEKSWGDFCELLTENQDIPVYRVEIVLYSGEKRQVSLSASWIAGETSDYIQICVQEEQERTSDITKAFEAIFALIYQSPTTEDAISQILSFAGQWTGVSRSYIFEAVSEKTTSNTYEWCAPGVEPMIEQLKELPKEDYSYDQIIERGLAVTDDIRKLSDEDTEILSAQGIKSLAVIPIMSHRGPLGYVGLDDCDKYRCWTQREVQFLSSLADILASLLVRRNTEQGLRYGLQVLDVVTNNLDSMILAIDTHTRQILFANNALAIMAESDPETVKHKTLKEAMPPECFSASYRDPLDEMLDHNGKIRHQSYVWEYYNPQSEKWYLMRDSIIKWIDGRDVLIETATEFTRQKAHEAELEYEASIDMMTRTYNREWSRKLLKNILKESTVRKNNTLVFVDLDRLKKTNDLYGHAAGDKMILETLECIKSCTRKSDVLCRWGGDEFLIIIRATTEQAETVMKKILNQMDLYNQNDSNPIKLSFSYGIVEIDSTKYRTVEDLVSEADRRMYQNKERLK